MEEVCQAVDEFFVLIPLGIYTNDMEKQLVELGFPAEHIMEVIVPMYNSDDLATENNYEEIFFNENNQFAIYREKENVSVDVFTEMLNSADVEPELILYGDNQCDEKIKYAIDEGYYFIVLNAALKKDLIAKGVSGKNILYFVIHMDYFQYFDSDIVPAHKKGTKEVFIDGGSFDLQTSVGFWNWCNGECSRIYAFECLNKSIEACGNRLKGDVRLKGITELIPKGLWSHNTELYFKEDDIYFGTASKIVNETTETKIEVTSIDSVLKGQKVTFIKMDIEGSEWEALKGARESIQKWHPILAISAYHKPEDIITLPALIKEIEPGYKLYLRCYHEEHTEVVLYAIWEKDLN